MNCKLNRWKRVLPLFLVFLFPSEKCFSQENGNHTESAELKGNVIDADLNKSLEYATISIYSLPDSLLIKGSISNRKGDFRIQKLKAGKYFYKVEYLGYHNYKSSELILQDNEKHILKESIALTIDTKNISQLEVIGDRDFARYELDKTVYNVSKSPVADGGTINEVLSTIPKLNVSASGGVQLRGSSDVKILIDGKLSGLLGMSPADVLSNMPAAEVDRVEVITSPSAKYDASGSAGIINIIMKKERAKGFNGNASASIGTINKHSGRTALSLRTGKFNFSGSYSYKNDWSGRDYEIIRLTSITDGLTLLNSKADVKFGDRNHTSQVGVDYLINDKNTLSLSLTNRDVKQNRNGKFTNRSFTKAGAFHPNSEPNFYDPNNDAITKHLKSNIDLDLNSWVYNLSYIRKFAKKGHELSFDAAYTKNKAENAGINGTYEDGNPVNESSDFFNSAREEAVVQIDYSLPIGEFSAIETGYMFRSNEIKYDEPSNLSTAFSYKESIQGLYFQMNGKKGKFAYQLGLRSEYSDIETNVNTDKDYFDFFPSAHFSFDISKNKLIKLSYSKMIYRPNSRMLNPFQNMSNPENQRFGNQELNAYYSQIPELTFIYKRPKITYSTNLYYLFFDNVIKQYRSVNEDDIAIVTYENLGDKRYAGIDFNIATKFKKWWSINSYFSAIYQDYKPPAHLNYKENDDFGFFGKITSTMVIPKMFTFQSIFKYDSKMPIPQGDYDQSFQVDLAFGKRIMKRKASITLRIVDVLNTSKYDVNTSGERFSQRMNFNFENRVASFTFRYYFGKKYKVLKAKKRSVENSHSEKDI